MHTMTPIEKALADVEARQMSVADEIIQHIGALLIGQSIHLSDGRVALLRASPEVRDKPTLAIDASFAASEADFEPPNFSGYLELVIRTGGYGGAV